MVLLGRGDAAVATRTLGVSSVRRHLTGRGDLAVALGVLIVFLANFNAYKVFGDGVEPFSFIQRLFGDRVTGSGYQFGSGLVDVPFYAIGKLAVAMGLGRGSSVPLPAAAVAAGAIVWVVLAAIGLYWLLTQLSLPARGFTVAASVLGTPIWFYASFSPSYTHAADAAAFTGAAVALWMVCRRDAVVWQVVLGASLGLLVTIRPFNAAVVAGCVGALFVYRRIRQGLTVGISSLVVYGLLVVVPVALGTALNKRADGTIVASAHDSFTGGRQVFGFAPLSPVKMLFSDHRGLFIWTPATLLAVIGLVFLLRRARGSERQYLGVLAAMGLTLLLAQVSLVFWDGGWSYSMRYFSSLLPVYGIGLGGWLVMLPGKRRMFATAAVVATTAWALIIGMNLAFGAPQSDGAVRLLTMRSPATFSRIAWDYSRVRHVVP